MVKYAKLLKGISKSTAIAVLIGIVLVAIGAFLAFGGLAPQQTPTVTTPIGTPTEEKKATPQKEETTPAQEQRLGIPVQKIVIITTTEADDPQRWAAVQAIAEEWRKLGFEVEVIGLEPSQVDKKCYYEWDFDVCVFGWGARIDRLDPNLFLSLITTGEIGEKGQGANNPTGYSNPEYDKLYEEQRRTLDIEKRREIVFKLQELWFEEVPRFNIYHSFVIAAYNSEKWSDPLIMPGVPLFHEWQPFFITPKQGGMQELIYGSHVEPDSLNPLGATLIFSWFVLKNIYDTLVRLSPSGQPVPWLAESIEVESPTSILIKIRENAKFHDGKPITAEDVKFSYEYFIANEFAYFRPYWKNVDRVEVVDKYTVRIYLKEPDATFITNSLYMIPILPKHVWENVENPSALSEEEIFEKLKVGSGPFKFVQWVKKEFIELEAFKDHFAFNGITAGDFEVPNLKASKLIIKIYGDLEGVVNALITKEVDATAVGLLPGHIETLEKYDYITVIKARSFALNADLMFNVRKSPFDIKEVRQALLYAIPYDYIIEVILKGLGEKGYIIAPVNSFWHNPDVKQYEYNPEKARELLASAGFMWDDKGRIYYPPGFTPKKQEDP